MKATIAGLKDHVGAEYPLRLGLSQPPQRQGRLYRPARRHRPLPVRHRKRQSRRRPLRPAYPPRPGILPDHDRPCPGRPRSPGGHELAVTAAQIVCPPADYPITPKEHGVEFLMKNRHLHLRSQRPWCTGRIRHTIIDAIRRFFNDNGFTLIDTPIFTNAAGEGEQTLFKVDYFGKPMSLRRPASFTSNVRP